jgi:hypothetical protein
MGDHDELKRVASDPAIRRLATGRAGSRELAEDALQEAYSNVVKRDLGAIDDLRAYFIRALVREIGHLRARPAPIFVEDIAAAGEREAAPSGRTPPDSVEHEAEIRRLAQRVLSRLDTDREQLMAAVPGRSGYPRRYRTAIVAAARAIFLLILQGNVSSADWNAVLRSVYSPWFGEAGLASDATDQRLSRGRYDVRTLLQRVLPRYELG